MEKMEKVWFRGWRRGIVLIGLALATVAANAQILYRFEKGTDGKPSYLLGTHHFAPLAVVDSIAELNEIMPAIDKLYGEVEMSEMQDQAVLMKMQQSLIAPADSTLDKLLTPAQLEKLEKILADYSGSPIPVSMMYQFKPIMLTTQLELMMSAKVLPDLNPMEGIDMTMQKRAQEKGKPVEGLETTDFQMNLLYNSPIAQQAKSLIKLIDDPAEQEAICIELSNAYLNHDLGKILEIMLKESADEPEEAEQLIYARNDKWLKQIVAETPENSLLVVVGAGHLPGERGLIEGLRKAGYNVEAIK